MEGLPTPEELEDALRSLRMLAGQLGQYRDMLVQAGFRHEEALELTLAYQEHVLTSGDE